MKPIQIENIDAYDWKQILDTSQSEGHNMVNRLVTEFRAGTNRFDAPGEALFVHLSGNSVIAVAGLNREPDTSIPQAGRIRRLYVVPDFRGKGLGRSLVDVIASTAKTDFDILTVNVGKIRARAFYEHIGFAAVKHPSITHEKGLAHNNAVQPTCKLAADC